MVAGLGVPIFRVFTVLNINRNALCSQENFKIGKW